MSILSDREIINQTFDLRNEQKKTINHDKKEIYFREWDIWRCGLWMNIRSESYGKWESFRRPILILKKLSADFCIAIPLSTKSKEWTRFCWYSLHGEKWTALLYQIRAIHKNRFQRKIWELDEKDILNIKKKLSALLNIS